MSLISISLSVLLASSTFAAEPNPPVWSDNTYIFTEDMTQEEIEAPVNAAFKANGNDPRQTATCGNGQFSDDRFAFMFVPGTYNVEVPVGYYTSVYGLGLSPSDTVFSGQNNSRGVFAEESCGIYTNGALCTFWRSAENFHTQTNYSWAVGTGLSWVVSQAAPIRNVKADHDLLLFEYIPEFCCAAGYASGGFASGMDVGGKTSFGSQQQYFVRSSKGASFDQPVWNGVFAAVDSEKMPAEQCGNGNRRKLTTATSTNPHWTGTKAVSDAEHAQIVQEKSMPLIAEKPYIATQDAGKTFQLVVPPVQKDTAAGVPWADKGVPNSKLIDFSKVYVTKTSDTATVMQAKLDAGLHLVVSPGVYALEEGLVVTHADTVILGLGFANFIAPSNGKPCITVASAGGVRIAGLLLEAGAWASSSLLHVRKDPSRRSPTDTLQDTVVLSDVFARVGGPTTGVGPVNQMFLIDRDSTIIDNTWLWRADHSTEGAVINSENPVANGLVVNGDHVYAYGLAVEHTLEDNVVWNGDYGTTFFFQAEIMYDYTKDLWPYSCYSLGKGATGHYASGLGCYLFFDYYAGHARSGFNTSLAINPTINKAANIYLNGVEGSAIDNLINTDSNFVDSTHLHSYSCEN